MTSNRLGGLDRKYIRKIKKVGKGIQKGYDVQRLVANAYDGTQTGGGWSHGLVMKGLTGKRTCKKGNLQNFKGRGCRGLRRISPRKDIFKGL